MTQTFHRIFLLTFVSLLVFSCGNERPKEEEKTAGTWRKHFLYPKYALGFTVYENDLQIRFTARNPHDTTKVYSEILFDKNGDGTVRSPYKKLCLTSTTHSFLFDAIGASNLVIGMSAMSYLQDPGLIEKYKKQNVTNIGKDDQLNREVIVSLQPDGMMVYPYDGGNYSDYTKAGITVLYNAEYLEENPLGRAEWIKIAGLIAEKEKKSLEVFEEIEHQYNAAKQLAAEHAGDLSVILGKPIDNVWHVPGNQSFAAQMVKDAGAKYLFSEVEGNNVQSRSAEWVLTKASDADCWIFTDYSVNDYTLADFSAQNKIYPFLGPVKKHKVFVCNSAKVDFFGKGVIEPHVMLSDMIFHFHGIPENYQPVYFKKLP